MEKQYLIKVDLIEVIVHNFETKILQIRTARGTIIGAFPGDVYELNDGELEVVANEEFGAPVVEEPNSLAVSETNDPGAKDIPPIDEPAVPEGTVDESTKDSIAEQPIKVEEPVEEPEKKEEAKELTAEDLAKEDKKKPK